MAKFVRQNQRLGVQKLRSYNGLYVRVPTFSELDAIQRYLNETNDKLEEEGDEADATRIDIELGFTKYLFEKGVICDSKGAAFEDLEEIPYDELPVSLVHEVVGFFQSDKVSMRNSTSAAA